MMTILPRILFTLLVFLLSFNLKAETYLEPEVFIKNEFNGELPKSSKIWIKGEVKEGFRKIMNRKGRKLMKYWTDGKKTVWILEEIGKARPITTGYVVQNKQITKVRVLIFRETHGYEVRHPTYTSQFEGATLKSMTKLDRDIDGISGATLSHWALEKMAKLALFLDSVVMD